MDLNSGWPETTASRQLPVSKDLSENPPWSGWDVLYIVMVMFGSLLICLLGLTMVVKRVAYPGVAFMQVLFFRGFLYPVVARRMGVIFAVLFTAVSFTAIHVPQLADPHMPLSASWGAVLLIFIIGLALTIVRAVKKSVAAGVLVHMAYNGFTSLAAIVVSGGFRHLDRLSH